MIILTYLIVLILFVGAYFILMAGLFILWKFLWKWILVPIGRFITDSGIEP